MIADIPLPTTDDPTDAPFWDAAMRSQLVVQACARCKTARHPPRAMCPYCQSMDVDWARASGRGRIWSFAVPRPPLLPAFASLTPYVTAVVELEDFPGIRMVGLMLDRVSGEIGNIDPTLFEIGDGVEVRFVKFAEDVWLPCWRPRD
ncbi:MAG: OB-fold domain-containing protein [Caulobacteraceae bacterium]|nr:OB-fold domain-containing protein [Caulobacteraceae bacterium]